MASGADSHLGSVTKLDRQLQQPSLSNLNHQRSSTNHDAPRSPGRCKNGRASCSLQTPVCCLSLTEVRATAVSILPRRPVLTPFMPPLYTFVPSPFDIMPFLMCLGLSHVLLDLPDAVQAACATTNPNPNSISSPWSSKFCNSSTTSPNLKPRS